MGLCFSAPSEPVPTVGPKNNEERRRRAKLDAKIVQERKREGKNEPLKSSTVSDLRYVFRIITSERHDTTFIYNTIPIHGEGIDEQEKGR